MRSAKNAVLLIPLAIVALLMFGGTSGATVLCEVEEPECQSADTYAESEVSAKLATGTNVVVKTSLGAIECKESTVKGKTLAKEAEPLPGEITGVTYSGCLLGSTECTLTAEGLPYEASITYSGEGDGPFAMVEMQTKTACGSALNCLHSAEPTGTLEGGEPAGLVFKAVPLTKVSGLLCPKEAEFTASYELQQPGGGMVVPAQRVARQTKLCKSAPAQGGNPEKLTCAGGEGYSGEIRGELAAGWAADFTVVGDATKKVTCNEAKWAGKFAENGAPAAVEGGIRTFTMKSNGGASCTSTLTGNPAVTVTMLNLPYSQSTVTYNGVEAPQGILGITGQNANNPVRVQLAFNAENCEYRRQSFVGSVLHGNPTTVLFEGRWGKQQGGGGCPANLQYEALLKFLRPVVGEPDKNVFVANE